MIDRLLQAFLQMICELQAEYLEAWMNEARSSEIKELHSFVAGIERDYGSQGWAHAQMESVAG